MKAVVRMTGSRSRRLAMTALVVALIAGVVPLLWRVLVGAGSVPAGDAWAYERIFLTYYETGHVRFVGWNDITLLGMLPVTEAWSTIAGSSRLALHALGSAMCVVSLGGAYSFFRALCAARPVWLLAVVGGWSALVGIAGTYLSDPFAIAGSMASLALCAWLWRGEVVGARNVVAISVAASLCAVYALTVRQQSAIPAVIGLLFLWRAPSRSRQSASIYGAVYVLIGVPFYLLRSGFAAGGEVQLVLSVGGVVAGLEGWFVAIGVVTALVAVGSGAAVRDVWREVVVLGAASCAAVAAVWTRAVPSDPGVAVIAETLPAFSVAVLIGAILIVASAGWIFVLRACLQRGRRHPSTLVDALAISLVGELMVILATGGYHIRYSFVSCVLALTLVGRSRRDVSPVVRSVTLAFVIAFSVVQLDYSLAPTRAVERAAEQAACLGIGPANLDASFSFDGRYFQGIASVDQSEPVSDGLPMTEQYKVFREMHRDAVVVDHRVADTADHTALGPFRSSGIFPTNSVSLWLVVRNRAVRPTTQSGALATCRFRAAEPRRPGEAHASMRRGWSDRPIRRTTTSPPDG